jgi:nucleotide-binding universal stress UspA family protein
MEFLCWSPLRIRQLDGFSGKLPRKYQSSQADEISCRTKPHDINANEGVEEDDMKDINKIMACVDLSDYSKMTVEYTLAVVRGLTAEVVLFNVIDSRDVDYLKNVGPHFPGGFKVANYLERVRKERQQAIEEMIEKHFQQEKARMRILIDVGVPFDAILKTIQAEEIDLVVIASKGKSNLIGTLFGSNAEKVFRHSTVPVLSVRSRERFSRKR